MRSESITRVNKRLLWQYVAKHRQQNITLILIIRQNKNYTKTRFYTKSDSLKLTFLILIYI